MALDPIPKCIADVAVRHAAAVLQTLPSPTLTTQKRLLCGRRLLSDGGLAV